MNRWLYVLAGVVLLHASCSESKPRVVDDPPPKFASTFAGVGPGGVVQLSGVNTKITFVVTKSNGSHAGGFNTVSGEIQLKSMSPGQSPPPEERTLISRVKAEIDADSVFSDDEGLTKRLKGDDGFRVKSHPKITFASTKIRSPEGKTEDMVIHGKLTVAGVTKEINFPVKGSYERSSFYMTGGFKIKRGDLGITTNEGPDKFDDDVSVTVKVGADPNPKKE